MLKFTIDQTTMPTDGDAVLGASSASRFTAAIRTGSADVRTG